MRPKNGYNRLGLAFIVTGDCNVTLDRLDLTCFAVHHHSNTIWVECDPRDAVLV